MNLAFKDACHAPARFALTSFGVAFLLTAVIGMVGLYRGVVEDALLIIERIDADLWVVQGERAGPFAEASAVAADVDRRVAGVPGVADVRRFSQFSQQFDFAGRMRRATVTGVDVPADDGRWLTLIAGRWLGAGRYEAVADAVTGLRIGDRVTLARDVYEIVGLTRGMVDSAGDGLLFVVINDATVIAQRRTSEEIHLARAAHGSSGAASADTSSVAQDSKIAAVLVRLDPAADHARVRAAIARWGDVAVLSTAEQRDLMLNARLWKLRLQILAFTLLILLITALVVSLIVYTMTIEKLHQIALLKLIGARERVVAGMIGQQAALIGFGGFLAAIGVSRLIFPLFPRRVVLLPSDLALLALLLAVICAVAAFVGIARASRVQAREVLS
ncbi:ABC transporter permease [Ancylobacter defluvii]|uniref:ABC transporter permease n=1 Tax=Ancylobacter defluvii TaxID=1282440 RepID=A0A9W6NCV1_9HYPH|nr:ABC transporter permease [Ancylobacter defluvii]MBS7586736.1 ABC transporter permease [Ancylobacter defluvii]GLK86037.1 ABC transporter permease [Ancylobacter defluvii]